MRWSRRELLRVLSTGGVWSSSTRLMREQGSSWMIGEPVAEVMATQATMMPEPPLGQIHAVHGYKLFILDFQFSDVAPETLKRADPEKLAEAMAEMGVDSLLVYAVTNSGFALYNSRYAPKFKNLRDTFLEEYLDACRKRKIKTVLYYSLGWQRTLDTLHPEWAVLDGSDRPVYYDPAIDGFMGRVNFLCLNSPFRQHSLQQVKEIAERFFFDSMFIDILFWAWDRSFVCYNPHCLNAWKERTGRDLPRPLPGALYPSYLDFVTDTYRSTYQEIKEQLKACGRNVPTTHNFGFDYEYDDYLVFESNPRGLDYYETAASCKLYRARAKGRELQMLPHLNNNYLDYVNAPLPKLKWQTAMILSHNAAVMWGQQANIDGTLDPATVRLGKEVFQVADRLIPGVRGTVPYAEMAILSSERDMVLSNGENYSDFYGAHKLLSDLHWPFDVVDVTHTAGSTDLAKYHLLIVPNVEYMSVSQRSGILEFLENGGRLFFCCRCAVFDDEGKPHLQPHFGLVETEGTQAPRGYFKPIFPIDDDRLKASNISTVVQKTGHKVLARLIRNSQTRRPGDPLTDVAYPLEETDLPVVVSGQRGKGHFIYAGFRLFREYIDQNLPLIGQVFSEFMASIYRPQVWVEAPTVVDVVYNQLGSKLRVALINGITGRPSSSRPSVGGDQRASGYVNIVEVIPIHNIRIHLKGKKVRRVTNLKDVELPFEMNHGDSEINLPRLDQFELINIEL